MKKFLWILLIIIVLLLGWRIIQQLTKKDESSGKSGKNSGMAIPVEIAAVKIATMQDIGRFSGSLKPRAAYSVSPRVSGKLERIMVHLGDKVTNGQLVAVIDDAVYQQELEQARAELAVVQAQVEQARLALKASEGNWNSIKNLFSRKYSSQAEMDQADAEHASVKAKYDIAQAQVQKAQAAFKKAEIQLSYTQIRATWTGSGARLVGEIFANEGELLSTNSTILSLVDNSVVTAEIDVIERDYNRIKIGQAVDIQTDAYPGKSFPGKLVRLAPVLQEASRQARAEIDIPNPAGLLKPGMYVRLQIMYSEHKNVAVVPLASLVKRNDKTGVFLVDKTTETVRFIPLSIGIKDNANAEVLEPIISGEVVVLGLEQLKDRSKVHLPQPKETNKQDTKKGIRP